MVSTQYSYLLVRLAREFARVDNKDDVLAFIEEHRHTVRSRNGVRVAVVPSEPL